MARRPLTARTITADFESPRSETSMGAAAGLAEGLHGLADRVVSSGPMGAFAQPQHIA